MATHTRSPCGYKHGDQLHNVCICIKMDASVHAINIISQLFGFRRESKYLIEKIKSFSRHTLIFHPVKYDLFAQTPDGAALETR